MYVSGQLRSRLRTDEDGRSYQDVRIVANGFFKIVDPTKVSDDSGAGVEGSSDAKSEAKHSSS